MEKKSFRKKLICGDLLLGSIITLPQVEIANIFLRAGFDWLFVDLEHSALSFKDARRIIQAVSPKIPCSIRVPSNDDFWIGKAIDIGASGLIVPQIKTPEDAERAVEYCKYPPEGKRRIGITGIHSYNEISNNQLESANEEIAVILQIEHVDAVDEIENILRVPGIDCVFIGPYDLSGSMGKIGLVGDTDVQYAIYRVINYAGIADVSLGIFCDTAEAIKPYIKRGFTFVVVGIDTMLIGKAAEEIIGFFK